jgi:ferredoxin-NADP reductase
LFLVCGPPVMLDVVETALRDLGVPARQIVSERFYYD